MLLRGDSVMDEEGWYLDNIDLTKSVVFDEEQEEQPQEDNE